MDDDERRRRLHETLRRKRQQRLGVEAPPAPDAVPNRATHAELSRRVEEELRKVFGSDPDAMRIAQPLIDNPLSALDGSVDVLANLSAEEKKAVECLVKMSHEEEAPPQ